MQTGHQPTPSSDDYELSGLEFFTRSTGVTGTVAITLNLGEETYRGYAQADLDPDRMGSELARLTGTAARMLNASAGGEFGQVLDGLEEDLAQAAARPKKPE